jgi:PST family polysaccharide transporter
VKLLRTGLLNGVATVVRMLSSIVLNKVLAVYIGPGGYALLGQFQNAAALATAFANGGINTGVTQYTAAYFDDEQRQHAVWRTAGFLSLAGSLAATLGIIVFHRPLTTSLLGDPAYVSITLWFAGTLVLVVFNGLLLSILNGKKEIGRFVAANIASSLIGAGMSAFLVTRLGMYGALLALAVNQSLVLLVTLALCRQVHWFRIRLLLGRPDRNSVRILAKFSLMAITSALMVPATQLLIRSHLGGAFGMHAAGYWQAMLKISDMYLMLITAPLAVYYLPRIAEIREGAELRGEILRGYALLIPVTALCGLGIFLFRDLVIATVFTSAFAPMRDLFGWQLLGDVCKIGSWLLGYAIVGQGMYKLFIATEVAFSLSLVSLSFALTSVMGLRGVTVAYCVNYALYWIVVGGILDRHLRVMTAGTREVAAPCSPEP